MSELSENFQIQENKPDHHYRTEIPNIVFEMGLDPFQLSVYCNLKRIAGDGGNCWCSTKTLSKICGMGETKLKECIKFLSSLPIPLIKIIPRKKPDGSPDSNIILITDVWKENGSYFRNNKSKKSDIGESLDDGGVGRHTTGGGSPHDHKEEPSKKERVVVVGDTPPLSEKEKKTTAQEKKVNDPSEFTKDELYFRANKLNKGWEVDEIEESWNIYSNADRKLISNPFAYIEGIINKNRSKAIINKEKQIKKIQKEKENKKCSQQEINQKNMPDTSKDFIVGKDMSESPLAKFARLNGLK